MSNLTFEEGLLKEHTPEPLEGHTVVVFVRVGEAGERFHAILPPGASLEKGRGFREIIFGPQAHYFAYAVDASSELHLDFSEHVVMGDHTHEFELLFDLYFSVGDPRQLASTRNKDPLKRTRERVVQVIVHEVAQLAWSAVLDGFVASAGMIVEDALPGLSAFAADYGIDISSLRLHAQLTERERDVADLDWQADRDIAAIRSQDRVDAVRRETEARRRGEEMARQLESAEITGRLRTMNAGNRVQDALVSGAVTALGTMAGKISTPEDLLAALRAGQATAGAITGTDGSRTVPGALGSGASAEQRILPSQAGRLGGLLAGMVAATQTIRIRSQRDRLRAALLHLVADVVDDRDEADPTRQHAGHARAALDALNPAPTPEEMELLRALANPDHLRNVLVD
jgi:hypothetical protein